MNLDELQSVQARERQSSDLQHLRSSFYREVGEYIAELTDRRSSLVAEVDEPFSSPEVRQLTDDIETAEQTVEAIYERRVGKVVKKASIAAAGMPVDDDGLTAEEEALFETLVDRIERNRETVLSVLDGEPPTVPDDGGAAPDGVPGSREAGSDAGRDSGATADATTPEVAGGDDAGGVEQDDVGVDPDGVDAADLMGGDEGDDGDETGPEDGPRSESGATDGKTTPTEGPPDAGPSGEQDPDRIGGDSEDAVQGGSEGESGDVHGGSGTPGVSPGLTSGGDEGESGSADSTAGGRPGGPGGSDVPGIPRTTVRITADVGEVVGADNRDYDLGPEDVVTLPEANADVLVEKDAAERLE